MLTRIVKLSCLSEQTETFLPTFNENKEYIRNSLGDRLLELCEDIRYLKLKFKNELTTNN